MLEGWAEPFSAFCTNLPIYPSTDLPTYQLTNLAWRYLLQNHPHDSICGCSVDQVHEDMQFRFDQVEQIGEEVTRRSLTSLVGHIATRSPKLNDSQEALPARDLVQPAPYVPIVVFNPTAGPRTDLVHVQVQIPPAWPGYELVDEEGRPLLWQQLCEKKLDFSLLGIDRRPSNQ